MKARRKSDGKEIDVRQAFLRTDLTAEQRYYEPYEQRVYLPSDLDLDMEDFGEEVDFPTKTEVADYGRLNEICNKQ